MHDTSFGNIIASQDFGRDDFFSIIDLTQKIKRGEVKPDLTGCIMANCFFEPSTRTRLSFESAMIQMGGNVIGFSEVATTSLAKGECLSDTLRTVEAYCDLIVIRHYLEGAAELASEVVDIPVINAGDGKHQHPTQTFLDLFTIYESQGSLEGLSIGFSGDLKHSRTVHSLTLALVHFKPRLYFITENPLQIPEEVTLAFKKNGIKFSLHHSLDEVIPKLDILYMQRLQKERIEGSGFKMNYPILNMKKLEKAKDNLKVLNPLPRIDEIDREVDNSKYAYYFQQAKNGVYLRKALIAKVMGVL